MYWLYILSVFLHILSAVIWIGGMVFLALVVVPVTRRLEDRAFASALVQSTGERFRWVGWVCLALLVASGATNLAYRGVGLEDVLTGRVWEGTFGAVLGSKLMLVSAILLLSAVHDFVVGPRATAVMLAKPGSPAAARARRRAGWMGRLNLLLALAAVALGILLVRGVA